LLGIFYINVKIQDPILFLGGGNVILVSMVSKPFASLKGLLIAFISSDNNIEPVTLLRTVRRKAEFPEVPDPDNRVFLYLEGTNKYEKTAPLPAGFGLYVMVRFPFLAAVCCYQ